MEVSVHPVTTRPVDPSSDVRSPSTSRVLFQLEFTQQVTDEQGFVYQQTVTPTQPLAVSVPVQASNGSGTINVQFGQRPLTGEDLGIPGERDIPDQRLPRPVPGQVIPTQLVDGHPVWVVGLEQDVAVYDARSPHMASGLVGWCGSMPGFSDSIGASRFDVLGRYHFGPSPTGLVEYRTVVATDHVTVTDILAPLPRADGLSVDGQDRYPVDVFEGADGPYCDIDYDKAMVANEQGYFLEDSRGDPTWVQHDLAEWPVFDGQSDGWFSTDQASLPQVGQLQGDLLVQRVGGRTVDAASPPGTARYLYEPAPGYRNGTHIGMLTGVGRRNVDGDEEITLDLQQVVWLTPEGVEEVDGSPPSTAQAVLLADGRNPSPTLYVVADGLAVPDRPGALVRITVTDDVVTRIRVMD
jgi:hypothetical protein